MGCLTGRDDIHGVACDDGSDETPARLVSLTRPLWVAENELQQDIWEDLGLTNRSFIRGAKHPVNTVNWWETLAAANLASEVDGLARCYTLLECNDQTPGEGFACDSVIVDSPSGHPKDCEGWRLPTEAEWEYIARAGTAFPYPGADAPDGFGNFDNIHTLKSGSFEQNQWGLFDISGNVYEWVWDLQGDYEGAPTEDPTLDATGTARAVRGGGFQSGPAGLRIANRDARQPQSSFPDVGVRFVRTATD